MPRRTAEGLPISTIDTSEPSLTIDQLVESFADKPTLAKQLREVLDPAPPNPSVNKSNNENGIVERLIAQAQTSGTRYKSSSSIIRAARRP